MEDAVVVLDWLGYEQPLGDGEWIHPETNDVRCTKPGCDLSLDANWCHGTLTAALAERLGVVVILHTLPDMFNDDHVVNFDDMSIDASGPTFEAALVSAAAKAVSG